MKAVLLLSGGLDSTALLHVLLRGDTEVHALSFDYGQRHHRELLAAAENCRQLSVPHEIVDVTAFRKLLRGSALTDDIDVPHGHYRDENMRLTVVPNRNMILLSLAIGYAVSICADAVAYAAHGGDHAIYPDCRPEFVEAMNKVAALANYRPILILTPFLHLDKGQILRVGLEAGMNPALTWTCYQGGPHPCQKCGACVERAEAFAACGAVDPLLNTKGATV
jgi:7-cyano-7-deazaguanine synthase